MLKKVNKVMIKKVNNKKRKQLKKNQQVEVENDF